MVTPVCIMSPTVLLRSEIPRNNARHACKYGRAPQMGHSDVSRYCFHQRWSAPTNDRAVANGDVCRAVSSISFGHTSLPIANKREKKKPGLSGVGLKIRSKVQMSLLIIREIGSERYRRLNNAGSFSRSRIYQRWSDNLIFPPRDNGGKVRPYREDRKTRR